MMPHHRGRRFPSAALLGVLLAVIFWGISFVATKTALREIPPITLIFTRFAIGSALLTGILALRRERLMPPVDCLLPLAAMGFVGVFVHQMLQAYGLTMTSAVNTGWLIGLTPIWSALLAGFFLRERFRGAKLAGLAAGCAGALLVVTRGEIRPGLLALPATRGDLLILASTLNWAIYTVLGHRTLRSLGPARASAGAMTMGCAMLAPFFIRIEGWRHYEALSAGGWVAVLFLGICCSGLGYFFWYAALEKIEASRVASVLYLEPLVTLAAAVVLLGEPVRPVAVAGGLLVLGGVALVQRAPRPVV
jgi:drug/metabolite transporter (DMT)-like permease